jgi:hypothetical protein
VSDERLRAVARSIDLITERMEKITVNSFTVIPSEVEESRDVTFWRFRGIPRLCFASLGMTPIP